MSDYTTTIGIECHVQLKTLTKLFAGIDNDARNAEPNTLVSHICLGMPGALPVLNEKAIELASKAAFALNTKPQPFSKFDRKHYFYPDLPLGYQITQFEEPIILGGHVDTVVNGEPKRFNITRAHLEADAGKSTHPAGQDYSLVDLNRAGTPLLEIVSEPEMHSAADAKAYAHELYLLMKYAGVSDADLYHGNMRFDVNVSVSKTDELGTRSETKNLNSFKSVEKAVDYEVKRQIDLLEHGKEVVQETRGWDDAKQKTFSQRTKEDAHDYRYFPDPDIPPVQLEDAFIEEVGSMMPELPAAYREQLSGIGIDAKVVEDIVNVPATALLIARILKNSGAEHAKRIAFWMVQKVDDTTDVAEANDDPVKVEDDKLVKLSQLVSDNKLSSTAAKEVLGEMLKTNEDPEAIANNKNLIQESNEDELLKIVDEVIAANESAANDVKNGEMKAIGFLVGQVMKASQGKANPPIVQGLIRKQLGI